MNFVADGTRSVVAKILTRSQITPEEDIEESPRRNQPESGHFNEIRSNEPNPFGGDSQLVNPHSNIGFSGISRMIVANNSGNVNNSVERCGRDPKLYQGNAWELMYFQRIMILSLIRLLVFIRKLYDDLQTTKTYSSSDNFGLFIVSSLTMLAPTLVFTLYRVSRFLQQALPLMRFRSANQQHQSRQNRSSSALKNQVELDSLVIARQSPNLVPNRYVHCPSITTINSVELAQHNQCHHLLINHSFS